MSDRQMSLIFTHEEKHIGRVEGFFPSRKEVIERAQVKIYLPLI